MLHASVYPSRCACVCVRALSRETDCPHLKQTVMSCKCARMLISYIQCCFAYSIHAHTHKHTQTHTHTHKHIHTQVAISSQGAANCGCKAGKAENDALDKRLEMHVELNETEVHHAALDLQSQYINEFEESDAIGAAELKPADEKDREDKADDMEESNGAQRRLLSDDADEEDVDGGAPATKPPMEAVLDVVVSARGAKEAARIVKHLTIEKINAALAAAGVLVGVLVGVCKGDVCECVTHSHAVCVCACVTHSDAETDLGILK
jgi:hypothetical protein